ncbi:hypothetical protein L6164_002711 [Bauhinia variegata]|uniref:Uncharacterized protein n=1 Tax=Bauhinia variegata TaxID=167791 RepID=A0ACB9Q0I7_BAUVA|nr:hypothetical protein L6164_002711 [Bauhinia variegata]
MWRRRKFQVLHMKNRVPPIEVVYCWTMLVTISYMAEHAVGQGSFAVVFQLMGEKKVATIQIVFAVIKGLEEPDRYVLLGNHRDAWTYGAVDPSSGSEALLDIACRFSLLLCLGWNPRRTIILCSWDAQEFGMIGSTEWDEQNLVNLGSKGVSYLNVDCAVQGRGFFTGSTRQLDNLLLEVAKWSRILTRRCNNT